MGTVERPRAVPAAICLFASAVTASFAGGTIEVLLPLIGTDVHATPLDLGALLAAVLLGTALFEIPSGLAALRWGPRAVVIGALVLGGAAYVGASLMADVYGLLAIFFLTGACAGLFFSPSVGLLTSYFSESRRGPVVGAFWGVLNGVGGMIGLLGGAYLGLAFGWRAPLVLGGAGLFVLAATAVLLLPKSSGQVGRKPGGMWRIGRRVFRSRSLWALALALGGFAGAGYMPVSYASTYFETVHPVWGIDAAAVVAAIGVGATVPGSLAGGWLAERGYDRRYIVLGFAAAFGLLVAAIPFLELWMLWLLYGVGGFLLGVVYGVLYLIPSYLAATKGEGVALAVGFILTVDWLFSSTLAAVFGYFATTRGFTFAWVFSALFSLLLLPLLLVVEPNRASRPGVPSRVPVQRVGRQQAEP